MGKQYIKRPSPPRRWDSERSPRFVNGKPVRACFERDGTGPPCDRDENHKGEHYAHKNKEHWPNELGENHG